MDAEIEAYEYQLSQVKLALEADPSNVELASLKTELEELISLTKLASGSAAPAPAGPAAPTSAAAPAAKPSNAAKGKAKETVPATSNGTGSVYAAKMGLKAGDECSARYKDGKWYPARITSIGGSYEVPVFTVIFRGYTAPQTLTAEQVRSTSGSSGPVDPSMMTIHEMSSKRKLTADEIEKEKEKKKKKSDKWTETMAAKTQETLQKKNAWEKFGKKAAKKGVKIGGLEGRSIFRTPDAPTGRVGVVGSGQSLVQYENRGKHKFGASQAGEE